MYIWNNHRERGKFKWGKMVGVEIGCCCFKDLKVHYFLWCSLHASVIFQHMECRRIGLPKLSHTELIFTHRDLRIFFLRTTWQAILWTFLITQKIVEQLLNYFLIVFPSRRCLFVPCIPCTDILAATFCFRGTKHGDFPHAEMLNRSVRAPCLIT